MKPNPEYMKAVGQRLEDARKRRGMTQKQVSGYFGSENTWTVSRWEKGVAMPRLDSFAKLCVIYGANPVYLLFGNRK